MFILMLLTLNIKKLNSLLSTKRISVIPIYVTLKSTLNTAIHKIVYHKHETTATVIA